MACAVWDRADISRRLLQQAGSHAHSLVAATNRYGQSVLHIAARRGCLPMLTMLAAASQLQSLEARNANGDTAAAIAAEYGHQEAAALLRGVIAERRGAAGPQNSGRRGQQRVVPPRRPRGGSLASAELCSLIR